MAGGQGQRGRRFQVGCGHAVRHEAEAAQRERARLVEDNGIGGGEPFEGRGRLQEDALLHQPGARQHLDDRHGQAQGAGAGDDQDGDRDHQRRLPSHAAQEGPAEEGGQRQAVHDGGVGPRHAVGQRHEAAAALLGHLHEADDLGQERAFAHGPDAHAQGGHEVDGAGKDAVARCYALRDGLAGDQAGVDLARAGEDGTVDADPFAGRHQHLLPGLEVRRAHAPRGAVGQDEGDGGGVQRQQALGGRAGAAAGALVEIAADQEEEEEGDGAVEIGVLAAVDGLPQAHARGQDHRQRDRHVHVGVPGAEGAQGRAEEGLGGVGDGRQGDQRLEPVQERAGGIPHAGGVTGPDRDCQQHDVGGGEAGDGEAAQEHGLAQAVGGGEPVGVERDDAVAEAGHEPGQLVAASGLARPAQRQPAGGEVDPAGLEAARMLERALDPPHAAAAMHALDQEVQCLEAARGLGADERHHVEAVGALGVDRAGEAEGGLGHVSGGSPARRRRRAHPDAAP